MKTILLITQIFIGLSILGQGNLQFNQTKLIEVTGNLTPNTQNGLLNVYTLLVPTGKTFKITSASITLYRPNDAAPYLTYVDNATLKIGNTNLAYMLPTNGYNWDSSKFPLWIPSGSYSVKINYKCSSVAGIYANGHISGVEFNIIP